MADHEDRVKAQTRVKLDMNGPVPCGRATLLGGVKQLMTCPYNESHRVGFAHFALHLIKCREKAPAHVLNEFVICKYNATHHMNRSVYDDHLKICDDYREHEEYQATLAQDFAMPPSMSTRPEFVDFRSWGCYAEPNEKKDQRPSHYGNKFRPSSAKTKSASLPKPR